MITAVDTNVLLDVFAADPKFGERSRGALRRCVAEGGLVACEVVFAEVAGAFPTAIEGRSALDGLGVAFSALTAEAALAAGAAWHAYRGREGSRERVVADFLVAAHAASLADRLLTRDRGFYRRYFSALTILDPGA